MSTQHPDNANFPEWCKAPIIEGDSEIHEAYFAYSALGCHEVMWDSEGKDVDTRVVRKLLNKYPDFFTDHEIGKDVFLNYRVPNPRIEGAERKVFIETLYNIAMACDVASTFYKKETVPIFEVIFPYTTDAREPLWLHNYYRKAIAATEVACQNNNLCIENWIGCFKPKSIEVIPLIEDFNSILNADKIVEPYLQNVKPKYLRVFIARSDPALNYGLVCSVLLSKLAISKLKALEKKLNTDICLILGVGSIPFRGHLSPRNVEEFLHEYKGISTVTIQSAFKYDYPVNQVSDCINTLNTRLSKREPKEIEIPKDEKLIKILLKSRLFYEGIVEKFAPLINSVANYVPPRRARKLHIGLFGYSRKVKGIMLPRAIPFVAALYSLGVPPELIGARFFEELREDEFELVENVYLNLKHDLDTAGGYLSWRNIEILKEFHQLIAEKAGMSGEELLATLQVLLKDFEVVESTLGVSLGPKKSEQKKHENFVNNFLLSYTEGDQIGASTAFLEAAKMRRCIG